MLQEKYASFYQASTQRRKIQINENYTLSYSPTHS